MKKTYTLTCLALLFLPYVHSQTSFTRPTINAEITQKNAAVKSAEYRMERTGEINSVSSDIKWRPVLTNRCIKKSHPSPFAEELANLKAEKTLLKQKGLNKGASEQANSSGATPPTIGVNFLGNTNNGGSPLDNNIAVSNGGKIVSVANTTIEYDDVSGYNYYFNDIVTFFNDNTITNVCDPVVLYDAGSDRFIFFAQECSGNSGNSKLLIAFSKSNDPMQGWWTYKLTGNPLSNSTWFDYPKLAVSNNELYISGNLFTDGTSSAFHTAVIYQIPKAPGYAGQSINYQYWSNLTGTPFTLLPVSFGHGANYGPGCIIVATNPLGSNIIHLYDLTDDMSASNEMINYYSVNTTSYSPAGDASQLGTNCLLDNGDCRALSGFFLNNVVHFVFHCDIGSGWNGVNYNRIDLGTGLNASTTFGSIGVADYSYPSVASFASTNTDKSVVIGFGRAANTIYPEVRVAACDDGGTWSNSVLVKQSNSYASYSSSTKERWGDYTGIARKHNENIPEVWMNGMYATPANKWNTWVAEINGLPTDLAEQQTVKKDVRVYPHPVIDDYSVSFSLEQSAELSFEIVDVQGRLVKEIYRVKAHSGENNFSFNKANLSAGTYFLQIKNGSTILKNEKMVIVN